MDRKWKKKKKQERMSRLGKSKRGREEINRGKIEEKRKLGSGRHSQTQPWPASNNGYIKSANTSEISWECWKIIHAAQINVCLFNNSYAAATRGSIWYHNFCCPSIDVKDVGSNCLIGAHSHHIWVILLTAHAIPNSGHEQRVNIIKER